MRFLFFNVNLLLMIDSTVTMKNIPSLWGNSTRLNTNRIIARNRNRRVMIISTISTISATTTATATVTRLEQR